MNNMLPTDQKVVLYVDDETTALKYFEQLFGDDFQIETAANGEDGWTFIEQHAERIAVLVTDQRMGEVSGVDLMERVQHRYPQIVRILVTAYTQLDYAVQAVNEGGAFRYLTKPIDEGEMIGTLKRAFDFHDLIVQREKLLKEKLSVFHRLIVMDRVRGLATAVTAFGSQLRDSWGAFESYMQQSPIEHRLKVQMADLAELNVAAIAKNEALQMVTTVDQLLQETTLCSSGWQESVDLVQAIQTVAERSAREMFDDDLDLAVVADGTFCIESDPGMLQKLVEIMIRRMADVQDQPTKLTLTVTPRGDEVALDLKGMFRSLDEDQLASFFSAVIPIRQWPIGMDMDLMSTFLLTHHLGGRVRIEPHPPSGPAIRVTLPRTRAQALTEDRRITAESFDKVYRSLETWIDESSELMQR
ncbi:response regulator [Roseiconus lacunae]|uniref:Response regulator n=2 Tax=Roseiconus lacunae TaxID=2605694 RepID=A0ABT7PNJ1_9BACT|nr:response regulator [Roseiconus lacunae]MDM4018048.1 response regulator [Roseiconus lacunae]